jgi:hypothetical protein
MVGVLLSLLAVLGLGIVIPSLFNDKTNTYGSKLEEYIVSNNPKNAGDVERLTREFSEKQKQGIV